MSLHEVTIAIGQGNIEMVLYLLSKHRITEATEAITVT